MKIVIIGGVAGGAAALTRLRKLDENNEILMIEKSGYVSFANCGLPYYIGDIIKDKEKLLIATAKFFKERFNADVKINTEVINIDKEKKELTLLNLLDNTQIIESYDKLILSLGAIPFVPPLDLEPVKNKTFDLRNIEDMDSIKDFINKNKVQNAVVIGGGFIGLEVAENLNHLGIDTSIVELLNQISPVIDYDLATIIHQNIKDNGVNLYLESQVINFDNCKVQVKHKENIHSLEADLIIMSIGIRPNTILLKDVVDLERGYVVVDEYLNTSQEDIYAIGDCIAIKNHFTDQISPIPLAWHASMQGRIIADNIIKDKKRKYSKAFGSAVLKIFDYDVASTGLNKRALLLNKIESQDVTIIRPNHASYYPGSSDLILKIHFNREGKILGAQALGKGVDKRIDVIATAIKGNLNIYDLQELQLVYAPPFSSSKDPVNIAGYVAENILENMYESINVIEFKEYQEKGYKILDIRTEVEFNSSHIEGAIHIELDKLRDQLDKLNKNDKYIVYCRVGARGYIASRILTQNNIDNVNLSGGYTLYKHYYQEQNSSFEIKKKTNLNQTVKIDHYIDAKGMQCPGPLIQISKKLQEIKINETVQIEVSDIGFENDVKGYSKNSNNKIISIKKENKTLKVVLQKGNNEVNTDTNNISNKDYQTIVMFSYDLDKAIAGFIIANGALAMGKKVSLFFTFWGLNILRKENTKVKDKDLISKMFSFMMPKGTAKLPISNMNMAGLGAKMIDGIMKKKNVMPLSELIDTFKNNGGKIIACTMSMDIMGLTEEELIDGIEYAGVGAYLSDANLAFSNLFI